MHHPSNFLRNSAICSIPLCFFLAGAGMLLLLKVVNADGDFYTRIQNQSDAWNIAHMILLGSSMLLLPAAIGIHSLIAGKKQALISSILIPIIGISSILLGGQYAIDFLMPEVARIGGEAKGVHQFLSRNGLVQLLFYQLPNLSSLGLFILSMLLVWDGRLPKYLIWILIINWLVVILGNLFSTEIQRTALLILGVTYIPIIRSFKT